MKMPDKSPLDAVMDLGYGNGEEQLEEFEFQHPEDVMPEGDDVDMVDQNGIDYLQTMDDAPAEENVDTTVVAPSAEPDRIAQLEAEISRLRQYIEENKAAERDDQQEGSGVKIVGDDEEIDILSRDGLNLISNRIIQAAVEQISPQIYEEATRAATLHAYAQDFYKANPELAGRKKEVQEIGAKIVESNPNITAEQLFAETAKAARAKFGIVKKDEKRAPGFTNVGGGMPIQSGGKQKMTVQQEVLSLIGVR